jgi:uncharacterized protein
VATLLDSSVLIPLVTDDHVHHDAASNWMLARSDALAVCPITQGSLLRFLIRVGYAVAEALEVWNGFVADLEPEHWHDDVFYDATVLRGVIGHRQVTDAYLAALARSRTGRLATFDAGLAATHPDIVELVPTE